jgi:pimeloyl-ACP methyl ester carboxylesterase
MGSSSLVLSSGRKLRYTELGRADGTPVLFMHGWPCSGTQATPLHAVANDLGLRIIAPDRPGIGGSDFHPGRCLLDWPPVIRELTAALAVDRFHLMGVSGGGLYVLALAHAMPERLLSVHVVSGAPSFHLLGGPRALPWHYTGLHAVRTLMPWSLTPAFHLGKQVSDLAERWTLIQLMMKAYLCRRDFEALFHAGWYGCVAQCFREAWTGNRDAMLTDGDIYMNPMGFDPAEITMPVTFWHGQRDKNIPWQLAQRMSQKLPQARCRWFADDGHFSVFILRGREVMSEMVAGL